MADSGTNEQLLFDFTFRSPGLLTDDRIAAPEDDSLIDEEGSSPVSAEEAPSSFFAPPVPEEGVRLREQRKKLMLQRDLQCAALAWLATGSPTAAALRVPTRLARFQADAAAFWSAPRKKRLLQPERTVLVETRISRQQCWPDCAGSEDLLPKLRAEKEQKEKLEAMIRETEPQLQDNDVLFPEYESWDYASSQNPDYKACLKRIREFETALYKGSRFERICRGNVANELYLAVPEGLIEASELAEGWGLLYVEKDLTIQMVKKAEHIDCPLENMLHLSQNIAASSLGDVLFANGISLNADMSISFRRKPRRRSKIAF